MVTLIKYGTLSGGEKYNVNVLNLDGLSTDTKPTVTYIEYGSDGREISRMGIPNGSLYTEIDTGDTYMYDTDGATWYKVSLGGGGGGGFTPTTAQLAAMNSGITSEGVEQIETNKNNISSIQNGIKNIYNMRSAVNANVICDCQSGYTWKSAISGVTAVPDTSDYIYGTQSMHFEDSGFQTTIAPTDCTNKIIVVKLKIDSITGIGTAINLLISDKYNMSAYIPITLFKNANSNCFSTGLWKDVAVVINPSRAFGNVDLTAIKYLRFTISTGSASFHIQSIALRDKGSQKPCISFTFDDGWSETMLGAQILGKYGIPATAYVFENCQLTVEELLSLKNDYNWDIECHHSVTMNNMTYEEIVEIIQRQQAFIRNNNLGNAEHWAYAGGQNSETLTNAVRRFCKSGRTISEETSVYEVIPTPLPYNLRAVSGVGASGNTVAKVKSCIDAIIANNGWLILVFHRIGSTVNSMFCSESDLNEIAQYAVSSGADIKTVADMWERN